MNYGTTIKKLIDYYGVSVTKLAEITEIPRKTLYAIIYRNSGKINRDVLNRILYAFDLSEDSFNNIMCEINASCTRSFGSDMRITKASVEKFPI